ncbi:hypothetical protein RD792_013709 [Penstemon davidsonii]|uniref:Fe2OG dioxygenase domain-containing protein n=1 Tax=Penstemon davidsonii TaxID=160366 RepID=A0ABR0CU91_9LAMI|nr:hypothetical protein RD792_013709 [Penstemon davidsonii]
MAAPTSQVPHHQSLSVKAVAESCIQSSVPSKYLFVNDINGSPSDSIPIIDFSLLTSTNLHHRSKALQELDKACVEWGFFVLVNHGIPETAMKSLIDGSLEFFELADEEKQRYEPKSVLDPIMSGNGSMPNSESHKILAWRDFLKISVHPTFYCPEKPETLREVLRDYSERVRNVFRELVEAVSENLELEQGYMDDVLKLDACFQRFVANYYPPCPQPDQVMGTPPHVDYGLFTLLIHNGLPGLQIQHNGDWFKPDHSPPNSLIVNIGRHLEIYSNGRYKGIKHRAVVNNHSPRISIIIVNGAAPDAIVGPAAPLVERDGRALYRPMKFIESVEAMLT